MYRKKNNVNNNYKMIKIYDKIIIEVSEIMEKVEKYIYLIVIIILVGIVSAGATYLIMDKKEENKITENNKQNTEDNNQNNLENNDENKEQIKLSEKELEEYLTYIPVQITKQVNDDYRFETIYSKKKTTIKDLKNNDLLSQVLFTLSDGVEEEEIIASDETAKRKMQQMYNISLASYKNTYDEEGNFVEYAAMHGGYGYSYNNGTFSLNFIGSGYEETTLMDSYKATDEELVIYSYFVTFDSMYNNDEIKDCYKNETIKIPLPSDGYNTEENVEKYIKENKNKFTKYKNTFKKNNEGYYWFSTEVVEEN